MSWKTRFFMTAGTITFICGSMFWLLRDMLSNWRVSFMIGCIWLFGMLALTGVIIHKERQRQRQ